MGRVGAVAVGALGAGIGALGGNPVRGQRSERDRCAARPDRLLAVDRDLVGRTAQPLRRGRADGRLQIGGRIDHAEPPITVERELNEPKPSRTWSVEP